MDIQTIVQTAFQKAVDIPVEEDSELKRNRKRSQNWVESLAATFREVYSEDESIRVFSKYHNKNRKEFGLNELLYDVAVCRISHLVSLVNKKRLAYIEKALWLVESEMAKDTRELVYDFNKLVIGDAENKLFVGPLTSYNEEILEVFKMIAVNCKGNVWVALVPHPGEREKKGPNNTMVKYLNKN